MKSRIIPMLLTTVMSLAAATTFFGCDKDEVKKAGNNVEKEADRGADAAKRDLEKAGAAANKDLNSANDAAGHAVDRAKAALDKDAADASFRDHEAFKLKIWAASEKATSQAASLLGDLQRAISDKKWTDAAPLVQKLDAIRGKIATDQQAAFDSLKKKYEDNRVEP